MPALTSRLVSSGGVLKQCGQVLCRYASGTTAVSPYQSTGDAAVKWNPQVDRTQPDYTTPIDKKTLEAKIEFYTRRMPDPRKDLAPTTNLPFVNITPDVPHKDSIWELWGSLYYPKDVCGRWPEDFKEYPERDTKNFPHPEIKDFGPKVRLGFLPDNWFQFFYNKTGVTGPYLFGVGTLMFLFQKEMIVWEHGMKRIYCYAIIIPWVVGLTHRIYMSFLDKVMINQTNTERNAIKNVIGQFRDLILEQQVLVDYHKLANIEVAKAKHENIDMELEAQYRERLRMVHAEVKRRMDYLVEVDAAQRRFEHRHMVDWIISEVRKSITPQLEKATLDQCFVDLKRMTQNI